MAEHVAGEYQKYSHCCVAQLYFGTCVVNSSLSGEVNLISNQAMP